MEHFLNPYPSGIESIESSCEGEAEGDWTSQIKEHQSDL